MNHRWAVCFARSVMILVGSCYSLTAQLPSIKIDVPATSDPWLAGMPNGSTASCGGGACDIAPAQSPVLVTGLTITPKTALSFSATGSVSYGSGHPFVGPDGGLDASGEPFPMQHDAGAQNGISDVSANLCSLVGVFIGPDRPDLIAAPPIGGALPSPALNQVFLIGASRTIVVPAGAARLYLGTMDGYEWRNNLGSFQVTISPMPAVSYLDPAASQQASQSYAFQFSHAAGWQALTVLNILINDSLDARKACYLAYSVPDNVLYLVADIGDGLLPGIVPGGGSVSNSQCTVDGVGSSVTKDRNMLTLTLKLGFSKSFTGNRIVYMAARDPVNNSGWQSMGVHGDPSLPSSFPYPIGMSPASGNTAAATLTLTYQDATSGANLQTMWALINGALDGRNACYIAYYAPGSQIYLVPDNGDGTQAQAIPLQGTATLANSQCKVSAAGSKVVQQGAQTIVTLNIAFQPSFAGSKVVWMATQTLGGAKVSPWQALGTWSVPGN